MATTTPCSAGENLTKRMEDYGTSEEYGSKNAIKRDRGFRRIRVTCPVCGVTLPSKLALKRHRKESKHYLRTLRSKSWRCDRCGLVFVGRLNYRKHMHDAHNHVAGKGPYYCRYCGRVFDRVYKVAAHTARCSMSPNHERNSEQTRQIMLKRFKHGMPNTTRMKISEALKSFYAEHKESASYKYNHYTKGSWAEDYFRDLFIREGITGWEQQFRVSRYRLDFAFTRNKIDFEVDGHQHYVDKRIIEHDKVRTANLEALGWRVVRVRWSEWNALSKEQKSKWLSDNLYRLLV